LALGNGHGFACPTSKVTAARGERTSCLSSNDKGPVDRTRHVRTRSPVPRGSDGWLGHFFRPMGGGPIGCHRRGVAVRKTLDYRLQPLGYPFLVGQCDDSNSATSPIE